MPLGMDQWLGLSYSCSAKEAVGVIIELLEAHGQAGRSHDHPKFRYDNSFLVADPDGAIVLRPDRRWATETFGAGAGPSRTG